jgi:hypothetical protein
MNTVDTWRYGGKEGIMEDRSDGVLEYWSDARKKGKLGNTEDRRQNETEGR